MTKTLLTEGDRFQVFALVRNQERAAKALGKLILCWDIDLCSSHHCLYKVPKECLKQCQLVILVWYRVLLTDSLVAGVGFLCAWWCETAYGVSRVTFIHGDITKPETLWPACHGMDAVVCAAGARAGWRLPCWNQDTPKCVDFQGVKDLSEAAALAGVNSLLICTSNRYMCQEPC